MRGIACVALAWVATAACATELPVISAVNGFREYCAAGNAKGVVKGSVLEVTDLGKDPQLLFKVTPFAAAAADGVVVRYRAFGQWRSTGEIFFSNNGSTGFHETRKWRLPPLVGDGEWHEWKLTEKDLVDVGQWRSAGLITDLRLDPVNDAGTPGCRIEFAEIRFTDSRAVESADAAVTPEDPAFRAKFDAPRWPAVVPEFPKTAPADTHVKPVDVISRGGTVEPVRARAGETVRVRFDFDGPRPVFPIKATVSIFGNGTLVWSEPLTLGAEAVESRGLDRWRLAFDYALPLYPDSRRMKLALTVPQLRITSTTQPEAEFSFTRAASIPGYEKPCRATVGEVGGVPRFIIDGKPVAGLWGTGSWLRRPDRFPRHSGAPLELVTVWPDTRQWWPRGEEFNPVGFDSVAEAMRRGYPEDCRFIVSIPLYPPTDWAVAHPDEMAQDEKGRASNEGPAGMTNYSFASKKARVLMLKMLEKAIRYLESSPYANRIVGYRVDSGHTFEWLGWDAPHSGEGLDFSPVAQAAFAAYLKARGLTQLGSAVPSMAERYARDGNSLFWDQEKHRRTVAYHDFYSREVAEAAIALCRHAKELVGGRKLVGTYFGYVMTLFTCGNQMRAHYATKMVLDSGAFDFLLSPQSYAIRNLGDTCGDMKPFKSLQDRGIVSAIEDDTRTHNSPGSPYMAMPTERHSVAIMRRNMAICLCRGEPFYTLPIIDGADMDFPAFATDADAWRIATEFALAQGTERHAEIAVVTSEESIKSMPLKPGVRDLYPDQWIQVYRPDGTVEEGNPQARSIITDNYYAIYTRLARFGAGCDYLLAEDLEHAKGTYKLYVFVNCLKATDAFRRAVARLRERNCTLLWMHAPGFVADGGNSVANMKTLTGLEFAQCEGTMDPEITLPDGKRCGGTGSKTAPYFTPLAPDETLGAYTANGKPAFTVKRTGRATTFFHGSYKLDLAALRIVAKRAGVFAFSETGDPVEANDAFFTLHTRFNGEKCVRLPRRADVVDVFNRRLVARGVESFTYAAPLHSTGLFYFGDAADELLEQLHYH